MAIFNVVRANRNKEGYMEKLIENMHTHEDATFRQGYGVVTFNVETIVNSFKATKNIYVKLTNINVHYMELIVEPEVALKDVVAFADWFGDFLYKNGFQTYVSLIRTEKESVIALAVNAVSYIDGHLFYDNNKCYAELYGILCKMLPREWNLTMSDSTYFDPEIKGGNYVHGLCV